jgi:hypothetical protein
MPNVSSPLAALLVLVVGVLAVGVYFVIERRHSRPHRSAKMAERLPLFGTDQLSIRSASGVMYGEATAHESEPHELDARPTRPTPPRPRPVPREAPVGTRRPMGAPSDDRSANGQAPSSNGRAPSPFAPPAPAAAPAVTPVPPKAPAPVAAPGASREVRDSRESRPTHTPPSWDAIPVTPRVAATATAEHPRATRTLAPPPAAESVVVGERAFVDAALIEGETLRFTVPTDATAEFLPGRLEVVAGPDAGREIRFMRTPGESNVEISFGRSEGPAHRHVQVLARTVSRQHAVMSLIDEHWQLTNVSTTNPLVVNGRVLATNEVAPLLLEGDRIEMGEVVFVFHDL